MWFPTIPSLKWPSSTPQVEQPFYVTDLKSVYLQKGPDKAQENRAIIRLVFTRWRGAEDFTKKIVFPEELRPLIKPILLQEYPDDAALIGVLPSDQPGWAHLNKVIDFLNKFFPNLPKIQPYPPTRNSDE